MVRKQGDPPEDVKMADSEGGEEVMIDDIKTGVGDIGEEVPVPGGEGVEIPIGVPEEKRVMQPEVTEQVQIDITERIHEIAETIVNERWEEFMSRIGDLVAWKERVNMNLSAIKQELIRTQERFENLQRAVLGRVEGYDKGIVEIHTEMKALEKVFERILDPLVTNVKELERITARLRGK